MKTTLSFSSKAGASVEEDEEDLLLKIEKKATTAIERDLENISLEESRISKILLLGTENSGKSTYFKQIKMTHASSYNEEEKQKFIPIIISNIYEIFYSLIKFCEFKYNSESIDDVTNVKKQSMTSESNEEKGILVELSKYKIEQKFDEIINHIIDVHEMHAKPELNYLNCELLSKLFFDNAIQLAYSKKYEFKLLSSVDHFIPRLKDIAMDNYIPSLEDIIHTRDKTEGLVELQFTKKKSTLRIIDIQGQKNNQKKWFHILDTVDFILFVVDISDYDQKCEHNPEINRLEESLNLFTDFTSNKLYLDKPIILTFNKYDIFKSKIKNINLNVCPLFQNAPENLSDEKSFNLIRKMFISKNSKNNRKIMTAKSNATNQKIVSEIFDRIYAFIVEILISNSTFY
eukprot:gene10746-3366_t